MAAQRIGAQGRWERRASVGPACMCSRGAGRGAARQGSRAQCSCEADAIPLCHALPGSSATWNGRRPAARARALCPCRPKRCRPRVPVPDAAAGSPRTLPTPLPWPTCHSAAVRCSALASHVMWERQLALEAMKAPQGKAAHPLDSTQGGHALLLHRHRAAADGAGRGGGAVCGGGRRRGRRHRCRSKEGQGCELPSRSLLPACCWTRSTQRSRESEAREHECACASAGHT